MKSQPFKIGNVIINPGERITLALPTPELYTFAPIYVPLHVIHGKKAGPTLLVCGSMHGDEINGVAIVQKFLKLRLLDNICGTLIVVPTINVYGMMTQSRNLPDRRDLDGSFPGSKTGSFAARLASFLTEEIFNKITHCIDLHSGESHILKFPQVKTSMKNLQAKELAQAFNAPVMLDTESNQGLLWMLSHQTNPVPTIIYEAGEGLRTDSQGIKMGVQGIVRVMRSIHMLSSSAKAGKNFTSMQLNSQQWVRAASSGLCEIFYKIGSFVSKGACLAKILDPFGTTQKEEMFAPFNGIVIAVNNLPILNEGEPILQLAEIQESAVKKIKNWTDENKGDLF